MKPKRGISVITDRGREALANYEDRIDTKALEQFPEYLDFRARSSSRRTPRLQELPGTTALEQATPEEVIADAYEEARSAIAEELLTLLIARGDAFFEDAVLDILVGLGYGGSKPEAAERVGGSGDGGIDGVIREDRLGLDAIYIQAKKWARQRTVGSREIREFLGALQDVEAAKGVFITTSSFSSGAKGLAHRRRVVLIDGHELADLMIDANVGVTTVKTYELKRIDEDYFPNDD
jgi:restriction system protein